MAVVTDPVMVPVDMEAAADTILAAPVALVIGTVDTPLGMAVVTAPVIAVVTTPVTADLARVMVVDTSALEAFISILAGTVIVIKTSVGTNGSMQSIGERSPVDFFVSM